MGSSRFSLALCPDRMRLCRLGQKNSLTLGMPRMSRLHSRSAGFGGRVIGRKMRTWKSISIPDRQRAQAAGTPVRAGPRFPATSRRRGLRVPSLLRVFASARKSSKSLKSMVALPRGRHPIGHQERALESRARGLLLAAIAAAIQSARFRSAAAARAAAVRGAQVRNLPRRPRTPARSAPPAIPQC